MKSVTFFQSGWIFDTSGRFCVKLGTLVENQFLFRMVGRAPGEIVENRASGVAAEQAEKLREAERRAAEAAAK